MQVYLELKDTTPNLCTLWWVERGVVEWYAELACIFLCVPPTREAGGALPMSVEPQDGYEHVSTTSKSYVMEISIEDDLPNGAYFEHGDLGFGMGSPAPISAYFPAGSTYADVAQNFFKKYVTEYTAAHLDATQISPTTFQCIGFCDGQGCTNQS